MSFVLGSYSPWGRDAEPVFGSYLQSDPKNKYRPIFVYGAKHSKRTHTLYLFDCFIQGSSLFGTIASKTLLCVISNTSLCVRLQ